MTKLFDLGLVFTGHMMDAVDRKTPRFPTFIYEDVVNAIRAKIREAWLQYEDMVLISGGARGSDIIALELAQRLEIPTHIVLPHNVDIFTKWSIGEPDHFFWERRMKKVLDGGIFEVLPGKSTISEMVDEDFALANQHMITVADYGAVKKKLLAVWDGKGGAEGGTAHFCNEMKSSGGEVEVINIADILDEKIKGFGAHLPYY